MAAALHDAPSWGQQNHGHAGGQGHPGGGGAAEQDGVAFVRRAAGNLLFVAEHQGAVGGAVAAAGLAAGQSEESHLAERCETCGGARLEIQSSIGPEDIRVPFKIGQTGLTAVCVCACV